MNKYIFMAAAAATLAFTSCEDALDSNNYTQADTSNFPTTVGDMKKELSAAYSVLNMFCKDPLQNPYLVYNLMGDECNGGGGTGDVECTAISQLMINKATLLDNAWEDVYIGMNRTNTVIFSIDNMDWTGAEADRNQMLGEAYFLRGLYTLWGTQFWGNIPAYWQSAVPDPCPQQDAETVLYPHILADFYAAAQLINQQTQGDGHATKFAAEGYLARAYMFYEGFYKKAGELATATPEAVALPSQEGCEGVSLTKQMVVDALADVINNGGYSLIADFRNLWQYTNEYTVEDYDYTKGQKLAFAGNGNEEQLFQIQFGNFASWNGTTSMGYTNMTSLYCGLRCDEDANGNVNGQLNTFPFGQGWGQGTINTQFVEDWPSSDPRKKASIVFCDEECETFAYTTSCSEETGYYNKKVIPITVKSGDVVTNWASTTDLYTWWGVARQKAGVTQNNGNSFQGDHFADIVLMRLADVYLMHTELTGDATYMNKVRERASLGTTSYSWDNLKNERKYELAFEGLRFNDLRRWSGKDGGATCEAAVALEKKNGTKINYTGTWGTLFHASSSFAQRYAATDGFLQIPTTQIELTGDESVLKQNPGWGTSVSEANMTAKPVYVKK